MPNSFLFKLPRPTLILTPNLKRFYGILERRRDSYRVQSYYYRNLRSVCTKRSLSDAQQLQFMIKKHLRPQ